jgi:GT2 family glycosyltransferase
VAGDVSPLQLDKVAVHPAERSVNTRVAAIIPTYDHLEYAVWAVDSFARNTTDGVAIIVDDASSTWTNHLEELLTRVADGCRLELHRYRSRGGLTRSWNKGLALARKLRCGLTVVTNDDVLFSPGWQEVCCSALNRGWHFVGPLSNAPGLVPSQLVGRYIKGYRVTDDRQAIVKTARTLCDTYGSEVAEGPINGFWMAGLTDSWYRYGYDATHVFDPKFKMTNNELDFQRRAKRRGARIGYCKGLFIFHYRSVSRGPLFAVVSPGTYRPPVRDSDSSIRTRRQRGD